MASLEHAIAESKPDFILPTDDEAVAHLHELHARCVQNGLCDDDIRELIEYSLGSPQNYGNIRSRSAIHDLAMKEGILVPNGMPIGGERDLEEWSARQEFPWVLKNDGSCAGSGVKIVGSLAEARRACRSLAAQPTLASALKSMIANRNATPMRTWLKRDRPGITAQGFVSGTPANCAVMCWKGEVLAAFSVSVSITQHPTGAASFVRLIDNPDMLGASQRLVRRLGMSGFCGLDFVIDDQTGEAYFIELNPRTTQLCHLPLGPGRDLAAAFCSRLMGVSAGGSPRIGIGDSIAIFPNAWLQGIGSAVISSDLHDVPWEEPELVNELIKRPWPERHLLNVTIERFRAFLSKGSKKSRFHDCRGTAQEAPRLVEGTGSPSAMVR